MSLPIFSTITSSTTVSEPTSSLPPQQKKKSERSDTATQSLYSEDIFKQQRSCVQSCFICCGVGADAVANELSCPNAALNSCYFRSDLQPVAVSFLSSCVSTATGPPMGQS